MIAIVRFNLSPQSTQLYTEVKRRHLKEALLRGEFNEKYEVQILYPP